jgi:hypothetical protein
MWVGCAVELIGELGQHHLEGQVLPGSCGGPWELVSRMFFRAWEVISTYMKDLLRKEIRIMGSHEGILLKPHRT